MQPGYSRIGDLPAELPIFPLTGVLLLPRGRLPLNIFEPRYLAMFDDAIAGSRLIGMIQPSAMKDDPCRGGVAGGAVMGSAVPGGLPRSAKPATAAIWLPSTGSCASA